MPTHAHAVRFGTRACDLREKPCHLPSEQTHLVFLLDRFTTCVANACKSRNLYFSSKVNCRTVYFQVVNLDPGDETIFFSAFVLEELESRVLRNVMKIRSMEINYADGRTLGSGCSVITYSPVTAGFVVL